jgi:hypothetical protein
MIIVVCVYAIIIWAVPSALREKRLVQRAKLDDCTNTQHTRSCLPPDLFICLFGYVDPVGVNYDGCVDYFPFANCLIEFQTSQKCINT